MDELSIVVPAYNERQTIGALLERLRAVPVPAQIIVVDDGSNDGTTELLKTEAATGTIELVLHPANRGKGAAIRSGLMRARGDVVIVQDADLEYDPADYPALLTPIEQGIADVVYGSRFLGTHRDMDIWHRAGNRVLTGACNLLYRTSLTDLETGYKVLTAEVARSLTIRSERWGVDPEITAKVIKGGWDIYEVPISYTARGVADGKKIRWRDSIAVVVALLRYRVLD